MSTIPQKRRCGRQGGRVPKLRQGGRFGVTQVIAAQQRAGHPGRGHSGSHDLVLATAVKTSAGNVRLANDQGRVGVRFGHELLRAPGLIVRAIEIAILID